MHNLRRTVNDSREQLESDSRSGAGTIAVGDGVVLCRVLGRLKMYVFAHDLSLAPHLMLDGYWEPWVTLAVARLVNVRDVVVNIGANVGYYALLMAELVGEHGHVLAVEPQADLVSLMKQSATVNGFDDGRIEFVECAVSDGSRHRASLATTGKWMGGAHLVRDDANPCATGTEYFVRDVACHTVDELLSKGEISKRDPDSAILLIIDAEGSEEAIWKGMSGIRSSQVAIRMVLEYTPKAYAMPGSLAESMASDGFDLFEVDASGTLIPTDSQTLSRTRGFTTVVAIRG